MVTNALVRMAQIIRQDPSITVEQLARHMGFAEQKSVYYWLNKEGFRGIRDFRKAVLTGHYPPRHVAAEEAQPYLPEQRYRLAVGFDEAGRPRFLPGSQPLPVAAPPAFLFRQPDSTYAPLVRENDLLVVDPDRSPADGSWVMVVQQGRVHLWICKRVGKLWLYQHPTEPCRPLSTQPGGKLVGVVSSLIRPLEPR